MEINSTEQIAQKTALFAALSSTILAIIKLLLFFFTGSLIIALSAWDSAMDALISFINKKIIRFAHREADDNHPYGHGRIESIAALGQSCLIIGGGLAIIFSSIKQIFYYFSNSNYVSPNQINWKYIVFFLCITAVSYAIYKNLFKMGKKINSPALLADAAHYLVDVMINLFTALGLLLVLISQYFILDAYLALGFAIYIIYGASKLLRTSINELMDHDIPAEIKDSVVQLIYKTHPQVIDVHKLRGRKMGTYYYFDCHVTLPSSLSFTQVHTIVEEIENNLQKSYGGDITVHADPDNNI